MAESISILYIDDDPFDRQLVRAILEDMPDQFELIEARSRQEFEAKFSEQEFDLILSDFDISGYDGLSLLQTVQAKDPHLPVIIVTGTGSEEIAVKALKQGAADYIIKTSSHLHHLPATIENVLEKKHLAQQQEQARTQLHFQAHILQNVQDGIQVTDLTGRTLYWNQGAEAIFGYTAAEMMGQTSAVLYPEQDLSELQADLENILAGQDYQGEWQGRHKDGSPIWIEVTTTVMRDEAGAASGFIGVFRDITERKRAEDALRRSETRYRQLTESSHDLIWEVDAEGTITFINEVAKQIYGYEPEEMIGWNFAQLMAPEDLEGAYQIFQEALETGQNIFQYENRVYNKAGEIVVLDAHAVVRRDDQGNIIGTMGTSQDITESKRQEQALRFRSTLLNAVGEAVIATNLAGEIIFWNKAAERMYGWQPAEVLGRNIIEITPSEEMVDAAAEIMQQLRQGRRWQGEFWVKRKDGTSFPALVTNAPLYDEDNKLSGILGVSRDITQLKQGEQALQQREQQLLEAQRIARLGSWRLDIQQNVLTWSDKVYKIFGVDKEAFGGTFEAFFSFVHPEDRDQLQQAQLPAVRGKAPLDLVHRIIRPDGAIRYVHERAELATFDDSGKTLTLIGTVQDITERKQAEQALRQTTAQLQAIIEASPAAIIVLDRAGHVTRWSPAAEQVFGWRAAEALGQPNPTVPPEYLEEYLTLFKQELQGATFSNLEVKRQRKDGTLIDVSISSAPLYGPQEEAASVLKIIVDITRRKQADETLKRYNERLEILHEIDRAILLARSPREISDAALRGLTHLIPYQWAGVGTFDFNRQLLIVLTSYLNNGPTDFDVGAHLPLDKLLLDTEKLQQGQVYQVEDYQALANPPPLVERIRQEGVRASLAIPLIVDEQLIGALGLGRKELEIFAAEEIEIAREVADQLAIAIQQARLLEAEQEQRQLAEALSETARILNSSLEVEEVLDKILASAGLVVPHEIGDILEVDEKGMVSFVRQKNYEKYGQAAWTAKRQFPFREYPVLKNIAKSGKAQVIPDTYAHPEWIIVPETGWIRSYVCAPIFKGEDLFGFISLSHTTPGFYETVHGEWLQTFANQAGFALKNAQLYEQIQAHAEGLEQRVAERTAELKEQYQLQAAQEERQRLARDLHDAVSQTLFSASLLAEAIPRLWENHPQQAQASLREMRQLNQKALAEMRSLLLELRPARLTDIPLADLLRRLIDDLIPLDGPEASLQIQGSPTLPPEVQVAFYRIAQEALNNVVKHAQASRVWLNLNSQPDHVQLNVKDDGRGFDPQRPASGRLGQSIMRERAEAINARLEINSQPGAGTEIRVVWLDDA